MVDADETMTWNVRPPEALRCAIRALRNEILEFRFDYPLQIVPKADKDSLHYHRYGDSLAWEALRLDPDRIPQACPPGTHRGLSSVRAHEKSESTAPSNLAAAGGRVSGSVTLFAVDWRARRTRASPPVAISSRLAGSGVAAT